MRVAQPLLLAALLSACATTPPAPAIVVPSLPEPVAEAAAAPVASSFLPVQPGERLKLTLKNGQVLYMSIVGVKDGKLLSPLGRPVASAEIASIELQRDLPEAPRRWVSVHLLALPPVGAVELAKAFRIESQGGAGMGVGLAGGQGGSSAASGLTMGAGVQASAGSGSGSLGTAAAGTTGLGGGGLGAGSGGLGGGAVGGAGAGLGGGGFSLGGGGGGAIPAGLLLPLLAGALWRRRVRG